MDLYDGFLHIVSTFPPWATAMLLGWLSSITFTQAFKYLVPLSFHPKDRAMMARIVAFLTGMITVYAMMPTALGALLGVVIGVWAPLAYRLLILCIQNRYPALTDILSADVRGTLFGRIGYSQKPRTQKVKP